MRWITLTGFKPYDGRYEFDLDGNEFTAREWGWLKRLAGYMPMTSWTGSPAATPSCSRASP